jgi:hypothetical protein
MSICIKSPEAVWSGRAFLCQRKPTLRHGGRSYYTQALDAIQMSSWRSPLRPEARQWHSDDAVLELRVAEERGAEHCAAALVVVHTRSLRHEERNRNSKFTKSVYDRIWQSPLKRGIWLISEDHLRKYAARKKKPGCSNTGYRLRTGGWSNTTLPLDLSGNFQRTRTHGVRWTGWES